MYARKKILVVDDDYGMQVFLTDFLSGDGYTVFSCGDGMSALEAFNKHNFDLLLTDIKLPRMDGIELIQKVRKVNPDTIILAMTGNATLESARKALQEGVYDYIYKPFNTYDIKTSIKNAFERSKLTRENTRLKELITILKVSNALNASSDLKHLLRTVLELSVSHTDALKGMLAIFDRDGESIKIKVSAGIDMEGSEYDEEIKDVFLLAHEQNAPVLVTYHKDNHPLQDEVVFRGDVQPLGMKKNEEMLIVPLRIKNNGLGIFMITRDTEIDNFSKGDLEYLLITANQAAVSIENTKLVKNIKKSYLSTIQSLALILEAKSPYTKGHSEKVTQVAMEIARKLNLSSQEIEVLIKGASLHDIGKIGISESLLNKPGKLTKEEFEIIKQHPIIGDEVLTPISFLEDIRPIVRHHHERMDGKGYPDQVMAKEISLYERIVVVADAYEAMSSDRPYRKGLKREEIIKEFENNAGTQFDENIVEVLLEMMRDGEDSL